MSGFLDEAEDYLSTLNEHLLLVEQGVHSGMDIDPEVVDAMFRAAHSLKGSAAFLNLDQMTQVTHLAESLLDEVRQGKRQFNETLFELLFRSGCGLGPIIVRVLCDLRRESSISVRFELRIRDFRFLDHLHLGAWAHRLVSSCDHVCRC